MIVGHAARTSWPPSVENLLWMSYASIVHEELWFWTHAGRFESLNGPNLGCFTCVCVKQSCACVVGVSWLQSVWINMQDWKPSGHFVLDRGGRVRGRESKETLAHWHIDTAHFLISPLRVCCNQNSLVCRRVCHLCVCVCICCATGRGLPRFEPFLLHQTHKCQYDVKSRRCLGRIYYSSKDRQ